MKKVFIFGDCHTARIWEHYSPRDCPVNLKMWGLAGTRIWDLPNRLPKAIKENLESSGVEAATKQIEFEPKVKFEEYLDSNLIMPWLGYVDIRQFLSKYNNADEVAKIYVETILNIFKDKKIRFIEPLPQFTEMLLKHEGISPSYEYEDRLKQNNLFIESLRKYSDEAGLMGPILQKGIYETVGHNEFTPEMTHTKAPHPVDGLKDEYNEKIYEFFIGEIINTLNFYYEEEEI